MHGRRLMVLVASSLVFGCGSEEKPLTPVEFTNRYAQEICAAVSQACLIPEASCMAGRLNERAQQDQSAISFGRAFLPTNAQTCLNQVNSVYGKIEGGKVALGAGDLLKVAQACGQVYRGARLANEPCGADEDCATGLICDRAKDPETGRCGPKSVVLQGAGCANIGEVCPQGFFCGKGAGVPTCQSKLDLGMACGDLAPCLESLRCSGGLCTSQLGIGEACAADQDCKSGFCETYAHKCAADVRFADGSAACLAMGST